MYRHLRMHWFEIRVAAARTAISAFAVLLGAASAEAQVAFQAPPHCGSQREFFASVRDLQQVEAAQVTLTSVVIAEPEPGTYQLILEGPDGSREFTDVDCRTLFRTAVVVAAAAARAPATPTADPVVPAAVGPVEGEPGSQSASNSSVAPPPTSAPPPTASSQNTSAPSASAVTIVNPPPAPSPPPKADANTPIDATADVPVGASVAGGLGVAIGLSPDPALVFELEGGLGRGAWGGVIGARYLAPSQATTQGEAGVRIESFGGRAAGYYRVLSRLRVAGGLSAYWIQARGVGIRYPSTDAVWLLAPEIEIALAVPLGTEWSAVIGWAGRLGLNSPSFQIQPEIEVFELPRFGLLGVFRVEWAPR